MYSTPTASSNLLVRHTALLRRLSSHSAHSTHFPFSNRFLEVPVNNFLPLLFVTFQKTYSIPLTQITLLITLNFGIQLVIDMLSAGFVDKIGYRASAIIAHVCSAAGLVLLTVLPGAFPDPFAGILIAVFIYAIGGGLIEVLISPILEACPTDNKEKAVSQWTSTFAEQGLGVSKTIGDLAGPMSFAALMGLSRLLYGKFGDKLNLDKFMRMSCLLCIAAYLCISLVPLPAVGLVGCAVCGFSVGIMWPGTFSKASAAVKGGGTALFAMLALAGDVGCSGGPTLAGFISGCFNGELRAGILAAIVFPVLLLIGIQLAKKLANNSADK